MKAVYLCALVAMATGACARTATRQPAVSAHITSLSDKDNRRKAMEHPAFANAGRQAGVEVWRIENFEPVLVPQSDRGKFYKGDSYIVLKTTADKRNKLSWDIHYWLGAATSQDEAGAAAILTVGLDDKFGGAAVQHRETQGYESQAFMALFQPAIRYLDGGHASGFSHVATNAGAAKRLFQVKGKRNVRVRQVTCTQVDPLISSMNKGDVFILDVDHDIYVYVGEKAKNVEKLKAISVANQIRDQDHNGRARIDTVDQYSSEADVQKFFAALGSGSRDLVPDESAGGDDQAFERSEEQTVVLSEISDSSGSLKVTPLPRPYTQEQLKPQECYILDTISGSIYVWVGKQATEREKTEAMNRAQQYLNAKNYPSWVHVSRVPQNAEPAAFKQYFTTWRDFGMKHSRIVRSASDEEFYNSDDEVSAKRGKLIGKTGAARGFMPDAGLGDYVVYRMENMAPVQIMSRADNKTPQLYQGDSYVIRYEANDGGRRSTVIYYWVGTDSTMDEQAAAAIYAVQIDTQLNGAGVIVRVPQGEEPKHFLKMFNGRLVTLFGGKASGFKTTKQQDQLATGDVSLFRIHGTTTGEDLRAEQVAARHSSLEADDVFLLRTPGRVYLWYGEDSTDTEREGSESFVRDICGDDVQYQVVQQGAETDEFNKYLAGSPSQVRPSSWRGKLHARIGVEARLFDADLNDDNSVSFEEISDFQQTDMASDDVYVLDTGDELYVWLGREAAPRMRKAYHHIAQAYLRGAGRASPVVVVVKEALEPELFTKIFPRWDPQMATKRQSYLEEREKVLRMNAL